MNIFILSTDPIEAARMQCDRHVVKMTLESTQLPSSASTFPIYKQTHINHPCSVWTRESIANYHWLFSHALALASEYRKRYSKSHACIEILARLSEQPEPDLPDIPRTPFAQAMPAILRIPNDPIRAYRNYYRLKAHTMSQFNYTNSSIPDWIFSESV